MGVLPDVSTGRDQQHTQAGALGLGQPQSRATDVAQVQFLLDIYVHSGAMTEEAARDMLSHAPQGVISRAMVCRDTGAPSAPQVFAPEQAQTEDGDVVPQGVHMAPHRSSRAQMLDWDSRHASLSPEAATGTDSRSTMRQVFAAHRQQQIESVFGAGANEDYVRSAIEIAEGLGRPEVAQHLRAALFRANQYAAVESLNVEDSSRYAPGGGHTYCNIYAYDMVTALGGYLPRVWWTSGAIRRIQAGAEVVTPQEYQRRQAAHEPLDNVIRPVYGETIGEMNANALTGWMDEWGGRFGWTEAADAAAAQEAANGGKVVIILAANANASRSGHVTVVLAEDTEHQAARDPDGTVVAPLQSQAGSSNFKYSSEQSERKQRSRWWENASHTNGGFWIYNGAVHSPLVTPESLGAR